MDFEQKYYKLVNAVADMRRRQKNYSRCKSSVDRIASSKAEKKVDDILLDEVSKVETLHKKLFE